MPQVKRVVRNLYGFALGINTNDNAHQIGAQLSEAQNIRITDEGNARKREGYSLLNASPIDSRYVTRIFQHIDNYGNKEYFSICGSALYRGDSTGSTWTEATDVLGQTKFLTRNIRASMLSWKGRVIVSNGEEPAFQFGLADYYTYSLYVPDAVRDDIQYFNQTGSFLGKWGSSGSGSSQFISPRFCDIETTNNYLYQVEASIGGWIKVFDLEGVFKFKFVHEIASGGGGGNAPFGLAIDNTNSHVYVSDSINDSITCYDLQGNFLSVFGSTGTGNGEFDQPRGMWVDETNDQLYVCDYVNDRIQILTVTPGTGALAYSAQFGSVGTGNDNFDQPSDIWGDATYVYIVDRGNDRIKKHELDGTYNAQQGSEGSGDGDFSSPIAIDSDGTNLFVADTGNNRIQYFNTSLTYQGKWGSVGFDDGTFGTNGISGIACAVSASSIGIDGFRDLGTPESPVATDTGSAGNPNGTYKYKVTYVTPTGLETTGSMESNSVTVTTNQINVTLSLSPIKVSEGDNEDAMARNIYRSKDAGGGAFGSYRFVAQVANNTAEEYDDNIADAVVAAAAGIPNTNTLIPACKYLVEYADILWGAGNYNNLNTFYYCDGSNPHAWQIFHNLPIGEDDKGLITGLGLLGDHIIVFKDNSIYALRPDYNLDVPDSKDMIGVSISWRTKRYGGLSHFAIAEASIEGSDGLIFLDKDMGVCFLHEGGVGEMSVDVLSDFTALDKIELRNANAVFFPDKELYLIGLTATGSTNNQVWAFSTKFKSWVKPWVDKTGNDEGYEWASCALIENSSGVNEIWSGDFAGTLYKHFTTEADGTNAIEAYFSTGWIDYGYPYSVKIFDRVSIDFIEKGAWSFTFYWAVDGAAFSDSMSISVAGTAGVRDKDGFTLPITRGKRIRYKIENNNASEPFEIVAIKCEMRVVGDF